MALLARRQNKNKSYFKRGQHYIECSEFRHRPNITQERANMDSQTTTSLRGTRKKHTGNVMVAEANTPLATRDVINEDR